MYTPRKTSDQTFARDVLKTRRPVLLDFHADGIGTCREMGPLVAELADHFRSDLRVYQVNAEENPHIVCAHKVKKVPTLILLLRGRELARWTGPALRYQLLEWLNQSLISRVA